MQAQGLPRFQYTLRDEATGAVFLAYASELSKTYATLASTRLIEHLRRFGIPLNEVEVRTDLGTEFDGDTRRYRPDGFHGSLLNAGVRHRFNPPARPNANADVESFHATVESEFFDLESFHGEAHFLCAIATYQTWFNFGRKNRSRHNQTPAQILACRDPTIDPRSLLLPATILSRSHLASLGQDLSGPPATLPACADGAVARFTLTGARSKSAACKRGSARIPPAAASQASGTWATRVANWAAMSL
jgi:transposase InsO family protein